MTLSQTDISPAAFIAQDEALLAELMALPEDARAELRWKWRDFWARPAQLAPKGDWSTWIILSGRGFGKTRSGTEWLREEQENGAGRMAIVGETAADVRDVLVEGPSGILAVTPKHNRPTYEPSKRRLTWPNGAIATLYNGTEPDQLRGPEHDRALVDELAKYKYPEDCWDNLQFGLRVGKNPRAMVTTTPRPIPIIRSILKDPTTVITRGSTWDNSANLPGAFLRRIEAKYIGTRIGRQEAFGEILDDLPGALWNTSDLEAARVQKPPQLKRIVVAIDPSGVANDSEGGDDIGIIAAGLGEDDEAYVLADKTIKGGPEVWSKVAVGLYHALEADRIVAETNFGGAMVEAVIRAVDPNVSYREVKASRGKVVRAEPIAALYEQHRVHHVGHFPELEDQMMLFGPVGFIGEGSPDRVDALVWAISDLMLGLVDLDYPWFVGK